MNLIDLVIVGAVGLLALLGLRSGLLKPAAGVGGLTLGVFLATQHTGAVAPLLEAQIADEPVRRVATFIGIVVLVAIAIRVSAHYVKQLMTALVVGWLDHVAGAMAGGRGGRPGRRGYCYLPARGIWPCKGGRGGLQARARDNEGFLIFD